MTERRRVAAGWRRRLAALAVLLAGSAAPVGAAEPAASAVIFAYQHFGDDSDPSSTIALEQFDAHLQELTRGDYAVLPIGDIVAALRGGGTLPDHTIGITIDDAHVSVYTAAWPRLRAAGLPFTVFVSSETVGTGSRMSWAQLRELAAAGVTIGNQTASYARMIDQDRAYNIGQILRAQDQLRAMLGEAPKLFAYPYGEATTTLRDMVAGMGFDAAFGIQSGVAHGQADRFQLPRFPMTDAFGSIERFRLSADALPLVVSEVSPAEAARTENPPHVGFTIDPAMGDLDQLACFASGFGRARVEQLGGRRIEIRLDEKLPPGRTRINCTLPTNDGRWRWFGLQLSIP